MASNAVRHPLHIDLHRQTQLFIPKVPQNNAHASIISSATTTSAILAALSDALAHPALTLLIEEYYRPILFELCARWITKPTITEDQIVAICLLIEVHEELFPSVKNSFQVFFSPHSHSHLGYCIDYSRDQNSRTASWQAVPPTSPTNIASINSSSRTTVSCKQTESFRPNSFGRWHHCQLLYGTPPSIAHLAC